MSLVTFKTSGSFKNTTKFFDFVSRGDYLDRKLNEYGIKGIKALQENTPKDTGLTANSWDYVIEKSKGSIKITWVNNNMAGRVPVVILLQYGHATKDGRYIQGIDFINPAMKPIFDEIADEIWKEVTNA